MRLTGYSCFTCSDTFASTVSEEIRLRAMRHAEQNRGHEVKLYAEVEDICQPPDTESQKLADKSELQRLVSEAVMKERDRCLRMLSTAKPPTPKCSPMYMGPLEWVYSLKEAVAEAIQSGSDQ